MNIMELVEGKKYKDQEGNEWWFDGCGSLVRGTWEDAYDITDIHTSKEIRNMTFTEVKEPITITLEAEELELIKKAWISCELMVCDVNVSTSITKKLNGIK